MRVFILGVGDGKLPSDVNPFQKVGVHACHHEASSSCRDDDDGDDADMQHGDGAMDM